MNPEVISALIYARRRMTKAMWQSAALRFFELPTCPNAVEVEHALALVTNPDGAWALRAAVTLDVELSGTAIGAAMFTIDRVDAGEVPQTELIWTGPGNSRFPIRRIDQVLYDLITSARRGIILVTFAAHRVHHLCRHLEDALQRGVELLLITESEEESEGQLSVDAVAAFPRLFAAGAKIYYWPLAKRARNHLGRPGKLHAKCAVVDDTALISSANLTDDAFNRNMELGLLVRESSTVAAMNAHFAELISTGVLMRVQS